MAKTKSMILGTFEGECADSRITNNNGLDITQEVWENVFKSEDYAQGIEMGWFIGFLGHPEDPGCQEFKDACIVMRDGRVESDGKIYGKFDLINTPVGRVVKSFIDAGVTFGISVRGAGDIVDNSVDPETFVFRGFDLVAFPAYPEAIPVFTEIAASSDVAKQKAYKSVCKAVKDNVNSITSSSALETIQAQFAKQSDEYKMIDQKLGKTSGVEDVITPTEDDIVNFAATKLDCMTSMYVEACAKIKRLQSIISDMRRKHAVEMSTMHRKLSSIQRITANQATLLKTDVEKSRNKYRVVVAANTRLKEEILEERESNLTYRRSLDHKLQNKDREIAGLNKELSKTVAASKKVEARTSNLDEKIRQLNSDVMEARRALTTSQNETSRAITASEKYRSDMLATRKLLSEFQKAYAELYANALGVTSAQYSISASTSVAELQDSVASSFAGNKSDVFVEPYTLGVVDDDEDTGDIVTL